MSQYWSLALMATTAAAASSCPMGFFHDGQACSTCPEYATTADEFAASVTGCMCLPGFFMRYDAGGVPSCKMCSDLHPPGTTVGTNCTDIATTVFDIPVVEGARETRHIAMRCVFAPSALGHRILP